MVKFFRQITLAIIVTLIMGGLVFAQEDNPSVRGVEQNKELRAELEKQVGVAPPEANDLQELCVFYHKRGIANSRLGRYDQSVTDLRQALVLSQPNRLTPNNWGDRWRIQNDLFNTLSSSGDRFAQIEHLNTVIAEVRKTNSRRYLFTQLFLIGPYVALGMLKEADEAYRRASEVLPEVKSRRDWVSEEYNVMDLYNRYSAWLLELRGNKVEAERFRRAALDNAKRYLPIALRVFGKESQIVRFATLNVAYASGLLAHNLSAQGKMGEAEILGNEALKNALSYYSFNTAGVSDALASLGNIKLQQGKIAAASRYIELATQALERSSVESYSTTLAWRRSQLGFVLSLQERWNDALSVFEMRDKGLRSSPKQFARIHSNHIDWAMALLKTGQSAQAAEMIRQYLNFYLKKPFAFADSVYVAQVRGYFGVILTEQGNHIEALAQFQAALPVLLNQAREDAGNEESGFIKAHRLRVILEGYLELLGHMHAVGGQTALPNVAAEAFKIADVARSSSVQRAVASSAARATIPDIQLSRLARREQDATNRIQSLNRILVRLASAPEDRRFQKVIGDMQRDIDNLTAEQIALRKEVAEKFPSYSELVDPKPATPEEMQRLLLQDEAAIAIYSGEHRSFVWTITRSNVTFRTVPLTRAQIARDVASIRRSLDLSDGRVREFDSAAAYRLYAALLAPDAAKWSVAKLINIIPHAELGQLPFSVLLTAPAAPTAPTDGKTKPAYATMPWLINGFAVAQQASASGFVSLRTATSNKGAEKPFIGFGDPVFIADAPSGTQRGGRFRNLQTFSTEDKTLELIELAQQSDKPIESAKSLSRPTLAQAFLTLSPLPDTSEELIEIAQTTGADKKNDLFLGNRATESNVKAVNLSDYRIIAFATHGLVPGELSGLDQPALALSNPALTNDTENDGFLTLEEVLGLKLNAEWVVLSACNTAGADGNAVEAVSGLGRAFFFAGARSLLVSNWAVETVSARLLTTGLFRYQFSHPAMLRAESLRQSMLELMTSPTNAYSHPAFWAPF